MTSRLGFPVSHARAWKLNFTLGNVIKYVARAGRKGEALTDLRKAREYLDREIAALEAEASAGKDVAELGRRR